MPMIECRTLYNQTRMVSSESMIQRPAVYGIIRHAGQLLVVQTRYTRKYALPGGGIEKGESIDAALIREVWEETGLTITVGEFVHFKTDFFYYDPMDLAIHGFLFFSEAQPLTTEITHIPDYPPDEDIERPLWVDIGVLTTDSFETHGEETMKLIRR